MDIALVFPKSTFLIDPMVYPPLGLWYIAAQLEAMGHQTHFYDLSVDGLPYDESFDQIWVSATSAQIAEVRRLGELFSRYSTPTVLGGPIVWCSSTSQEDLGYSLQVAGEVDYPETIYSVLYFAERATRQNRHRIYECSSPATLDHVLPPIRRWQDKYHATLEGERCTTMFTSRGCPYACAFCESGRNGIIWGKKVRFEPIGIVRDQIDEIAVSHGAIQFYDDILPINVKRMHDIGRHLKQRQLIWRCFLRSDLTIHRGFELLKYMRDCGLVEVLVGVESGSDRIKSNIHKGTTIEQDSLVLRWCKTLDIKFKASLILGLPGETLDTMQATLDWILDNHPDRVDLNMLIPFPNTPITREPEKYDLHSTVEVPEEYWYKGNQKELQSLVETSSLTANQIKEFHYRAIKRIDEAGIPY